MSADGTIRTVLLFLAALWGVHGLPAAAQENPSLHLHAENIELFSADEAAVEPLRFALAVASREVDSCLGWRQPHSLPVIVRYGEADETPSSTATESVYRLAVTPDTPFQRLFHLALTLLIRRTAAEIIPAKGAAIPSVGWLSAALYHRIVTDGKELTSHYMPDFRHARRLYAKGSFPDFARLVDSPLTPDDGILFEVYALHCDVLATALDNRVSDRQSFFRHVFTLEHYGRRPSDALAFQLKNLALANPDVQAWYEQQALVESQRGQRLLDLAGLRQRLREMLVITVLEADTGAATFTIDLGELPEKLSDYKIKPAAIANLQKQFLWLQRESPPCLQDAVYQFALALEPLKKNNRRQFELALHRAQRAFEEAAGRQARIEAMLDELDDRTTARLLPELAGLAEKYRRLKTDFSLLTEQP